MWSIKNANKQTKKDAVVIINFKVTASLGYGIVYIGVFSSLWMYSQSQMTGTEFSILYHDLCKVAQLVNHKALDYKIPLSSPHLGFFVVCFFCNQDGNEANTQKASKRV